MSFLRFQGWIDGETMSQPLLPTLVWPFCHLPCEGAVPLVFRSLSEEMVPYVAAALAGQWEELSPGSSCVGILDCPPVSSSYPFFFFNLQIYNNVGSPALTLNQISLMFHHLGYYLLIFANQSSREGNGNPLQYSCLENPRMEEPGRLQTMGSLNWT